MPGVAAPSSPLVETLVVSGRAAPAVAKGIASNSRAELPPGARLEVAELLQGLPGVQLDNRTNLAQDARISLRGFGARSAFGVRGIKLLVDGVPMTQADGQGQLSSPLLDNIERVEVIRGPLAGLYGSGAGGVIALHSPVPEHNRAQLALAGGDYGLRRQSLAVEGQAGAWRGRIAAAASEQVGARPHTAAEREQWAAQGYYLADTGLQLSLKHEHSRDPLLQDPLGLSPAQWRDAPYQANSVAETFNTRKSVDHRQTSLSLQQSMAAWHWQLSAWKGARDIRQYLGFSGDGASSSGGVVDLARDFAGVRATLGRDMDLLGRPLNASLGLEWASMDDRRRGYVNNLGQAGELRRNELGEVEARDAYGLLHWQWSQALALYGGLRHSQQEFAVKDAYITPANPDDSGARRYRDQSHALGASYQLGRRWALFAASGDGFEAPTLTEMAYRREGTGLNTGLAAAQIRQQELGLGFSGADLSTSFSHFRIRTRDELVVDQSLGGRTSYRNAAATERHGLEWFGRWQWQPHWRLHWAWHSMAARYSSGDWQGNNLPGVAREQWQTDIYYLPWGSERLQLGLGWHKRSRIASSDANTDFAPGYQRIDLSLQGEEAIGPNRLHWWLRLGNASDENSVGSVIVNASNGRSFEPAAGRSLMAGIELGFE